MKVDVAPFRQVEVRAHTGENLPAIKKLTQVKIGFDPQYAGGGEYSNIYAVSAAAAADQYQSQAVLHQLIPITPWLFGPPLASL